jgi:hypothetical protein
MPFNEEANKKNSNESNVNHSSDQKGVYPTTLNKESAGNLGENESTKTSQISSAEDNKGASIVSRLSRDLIKSPDLSVIAESDLIERGSAPITITNSVSGPRISTTYETPFGDVTIGTDASVTIKPAYSISSIGLKVDKFVYGVKVPTGLNTQYGIKFEVDKDRVKDAAVVVFSLVTKSAGKQQKIEVPKTRPSISPAF